MDSTQQAAGEGSEIAHEKRHFTLESRASRVGTAVADASPKRYPMKTLSLAALAFGITVAACSSDPDAAPSSASPVGAGTTPGAVPTSPVPGSDADGGADSAADATTPKAVTLGTVKEKGSCTHPTALANATCHAVTVEGCPGVPAIDAEVLVAEPSSGTPPGTIVFGSGGGGGAYYEDAGDGAGAAGPMLERLRAKGFRIVERAWAGPPQSGQWFEGTAGPTASSCRYATLATWIKQRFTQNKGKFCGTGNSGGSVELAYALTRQGRGEIFDYALLTSGPAASMDLHCETIPSASWQAQCNQLLAGHTWECNGAKPVCNFDPGIKLLIDSSFGSDTPCATGGAANAQKLIDGSPIGPGATVAFPKTKIEQLLGAKDCRNGVVPSGLAFTKAVTTMGAPPKTTVLVGVGHSIHAEVDGARAIELAMDASCR